MNKASFFLLTVFAALLFLACEPAKKGGGDFAPSSTNDGTIQSAAGEQEDFSENEVEDSLEKTTEIKKQ